jgi:hypothetical protein
MITALSIQVSSVNATVSQLFAIFVSITMAEFHFRSIEALDIDSDVTVQFLVGGLVIHFTGIFHVSCSVQKLCKKFYAFEAVRKFFQFLAANMTLENFFFTNLETSERHFPEKLCVEWGIMVQVTTSVRAVACRGPEE